MKMKVNLMLMLNLVLDLTFFGFGVDFGVGIGLDIGAGAGAGVGVGVRFGFLRSSSSYNNQTHRWNPVVWSDDADDACLLRTRLAISREQVLLRHGCDRG